MYPSSGPGAPNPSDRDRQGRHRNTEVSPTFNHRPITLRGPRPTLPGLSTLFTPPQRPGMGAMFVPQRPRTSMGVTSRPVTGSGAPPPEQHAQPGGYPGGGLNRTSEGLESGGNSSASPTLASPDTRRGPGRPRSNTRGHVSFESDDAYGVQQKPGPETMEDLKAPLKEQTRENKILKDKIERRERTMEDLRADLRGVEQLVVEKEKELAEVRGLAGMGGGQAAGGTAEAGRRGGM